MARAKLHKTWADYVAIALSPMLIMLLVGSLAFFLLEVTYSGQHPQQMRWLLFWFVFAAVLIARIQIELEANESVRYAVLLAGATLLFVFRFVDAPVVAIFLLAVIWWCSHKLTWDCTLIDDSQDSSGEGLLKASGLDRHTSEGNRTPSSETETSPRRFWQKKQKEKQPHSPGLWVVYFSLAALPLFGLGQVFLPANDAARRTFAFQMLLIYVASGLGLLLTTSFLGLRRYLRQRKLKMPVRMTGMWIGAGGIMVGLVLAMCLLLPRPQAVYSATAILDRLGSKDREASQMAMKEGNAGQGEGQQIGEKNPDQKPEDQPQQAQNEQNNNEGEPGKGNGQTEEQTEEKQAGDQGEQQANVQGAQQGDQQQPGKQAQGDQQQNAQNTPQSQHPDSNAPQSALEKFAQIPSSVAQLLKWIIYGMLAIGGLWFLWKQGAALLNGLLQLLRDLLGLFSGGAKQPKKAAEEDAASSTMPQLRKSFKEYPNPFNGGVKQDPAVLVKYTYEALCAWGLEHGHVPKTDQTPMEFTSRLADRLLSVDPDGQFMNDLKQLGRIYSAMAYARRKPPAGTEVVLQRLWRSLTTFQGPLPKPFDPSAIPELQGWGG